VAGFTAVPGLEAIVARMIAPAVEDIGRQVEEEAKKLAPPTKQWITVEDDKVRVTHRAAHGQIVPDNLRFSVPSMDWDMKHRGVGPITYFKQPRDESSRAVANLKHCRCITRTDEEGIAREVNRTGAVFEGHEVKVTVYAQGKWIIQAEYGTVYPGNLPAPGTHFMARAAANVATRREG
jgi:hypothetical protein